MAKQSSSSTLSTLPSVSISANCRGVTVATSGPKAEAHSSVHIPIEFLPGIIALLQGELNNINKGYYCLDPGALDTQTTKAEDPPQESIEPGRILVLNARK